MRVGHHGQDGSGSDSEDEDGRRRRRRRRKDEGEEEGGDRERVSNMIIVTIINDIINFSFKHKNLSHLTSASSLTMTVQSSNSVVREKRRRKTTFIVETCKYRIITQNSIHTCPRFLPSFSCTLHWVKIEGG